MHVVVAPVLVGDRICRIIAAVSSLLEVEEWTGRWWEPSGVTLSAAATSPPVEPQVLRARGVPPEDCIVHAHVAGRLDIEELLRTHDAEHPPQMRLDDDVKRARAPKTRSYPGNVRFRRVTDVSAPAQEIVIVRDDTARHDAAAAPERRRRPKRNGST